MNELGSVEVRDFLIQTISRQGTKIGSFVEKVPNMVLKAALEKSDLKMLTTFFAFFAAHLISDFILQFDAITKGKRGTSRGKKAGAFTAHGLIVGIISVGLVAPNTCVQWIGIFAIVFSHIAIDFIKMKSDVNGWFGQKRGNLWTFVADQALHVAIIALVVFLSFDTFNQWGWMQRIATHEQTQQLYIVISGYIVTTRVGQFVIKMFMAGLNSNTSASGQGKNAKEENEKEEELENAGAWIGLLERNLVFLLVFTESLAAVGFLVAAKSVLRIREQRLETEYVIIGTLASFSWAIMISMATKALL